MGAMDSLRPEPMSGWRRQLNAAAWGAIAVVLTSLFLALVAYRQRFAWTLPLGEIPALPLMTGMMLAGASFLLLGPLLRLGTHLDGIAGRRLLGFIITVGLLLRLMMFATEPALEDDQQRYLWEGALVANGLSPYRLSPADGKAADRTTRLGQVADQAGAVLERVNNPKLKTIYPPVIEAAFALAYRLQPFSLNAWRLVLLAADCGTLGLLLLLLRDIGRPAPWVALYWWNPIVVKEVFNSGHMEGLLMLAVMAAIVLAKRRHFTWASGALGLAAGIKIWPLLLAPLLLRPLLARPMALVRPLGLLGLISVLCTWPILAGGLDERSGFIAYAKDWQANGALLPGLRGLIGLFGAPYELAGRLARGVLAVTAISMSLWLARLPLRNTADLLGRAALVTLALVLTSPAQFPWYAIWTLPFLVFVPRPGVLAMAVFLPIYYASFYFRGIGQYPIFRDWIVWLIWLPIWLLLAREAWTTLWPRHRWRRAANQLQDQEG